MKQNVLDRFSKTGRLRLRFQEVMEQVAKQEIPRMNAGDLIGSHIVANLTALPQRSEDESQLLFDAQRARAVLYHESNGATSLESAEALCEARAALQEMGDPGDDLGSLVELAAAILGELRTIGSRRNAWSVFQVLVDGVLGSSGAQDERAPEITATFLELADKILESNFDASVLDVLLRLCDWTRGVHPESFPKLAEALPNILGAHFEDIPTKTAMRAYLYARHLSVGFSGEVFEKLVYRVAGKELYGQEARSIYQEFLESRGDLRAPMEEIFSDLAYVNPAVDLEPDSDLDALNHMLADYYPESAWLWRNRALMFRRRGDPIGALACVARGMDLNGEPPEIMGLMAPVIAGMGFVTTAFQFSRFLPTETRKRFELEVLDLLCAEPSSATGRKRLIEKLKGAAKRPTVPAEFKEPIRRRLADLYQELGDDVACEAILAEILADNTADDLTAVRLAEMAFRAGDHKRAKRALNARFSARSLPLAEHLRSQLASEDGNYDKAYEHNELALGSLGAAQAAGRDHPMKGVVVLRDRIVRMHGPEHAEGALLAMLQVETHAPRHHDLDLLLPILERRKIELSLNRGDSEGARKYIRDLVEQRPCDTEIFIEGARASLRSNHLEEADEFFARAVDAGHGESSEIMLLRALRAMRDDDDETASEWLERLSGRATSAEARLLRAILALKSDNEKAAAEHLAGFDKQEGGTPEIRHRIYDLRGRLAERAGLIAEAREHYAAAIHEKSGWTEARRRAGLLTVQAALEGDGSVRDASELARGLELLEGYNDADSVVHHVLGRAAQIEHPLEASLLIESALTRTAGEAWLRLQCRRVGLLLLAKEPRAARRVLESMSEEAKPTPALMRRIGRSLGAIFR
ncbi:MAG: hypothetical protein KDB53_21710, partial [Planctomycetes bacterium]|nr:hypothetical protein [Planctomycetota bacterium]